MKTVVFSQEAREELDRAYAESLALGSSIYERFKIEVRDALETIGANPEAGGEVGWREYRRFIFHTPPYSFIYCEEADSISIAAFAHHSRKPSYWRKRLTS